MIAWIVIISMVLGLTVLRWLRWSSIWQQKEYRFDRLWLYLKTVEGRRELTSLLPNLHELKSLTLRRPHLTSRVLSIWAVATLLVVWATLGLGWNWVRIIGFIWLFTPAVVIFCGLPLHVLVWLYTLYTLRRAQRLFAKSRPVVIGVTGSYGKTSTKQLIAALLGPPNAVFVTPKSHNNKLSVARAICRQYTGQKYAVIEYAAYTQHEIRDLASWIKPTIAVITGLTPQHLGLFGSINQIVAAKAALVSALPDNGVVYFNQDDAGTSEIVQLGLGNRQLTTRAYDQFGSETISISSAGVSVDGRLQLVIENQAIKTQIVGQHYLPAIAAALTLAIDLGVALDTALDRLTAFQPGTNFTRLHQLKSGVRVLDDGGTSNPAGFLANLELVELLQQQQPVQKTVMLFAGIADLGRHSDELHEQLIQKAVGIVDEFWYTSSIALPICQQIYHSNCIADRQEIISRLKQLEPNTLLCIEGKVPGWLAGTLQQQQLSS